jgi:NADP-dependent 3-hydroxy acid dehydrogenase YdfG
MTFQNVFITGASSGLGRGLALHYANAGSTVFAAARRLPELEALAKEVKSGAGQVIPVQLDVADLEALVSAVHEAETKSGGALDLLIANAGIGSPTDARDSDWREINRIFHVNVNAAAATIAAGLPAMVAKNAGTVAVVSSLAAWRGLPSNSAYCGSKAAMQMFMESVRVDLKKTSVRALTIYPGFVKTELTARNKYPMPFLMELDDAVKTMVRGIEKGKRSIAFPLPLALIMGWVAGLPAFLWEILGSEIAPPRPKKPDGK